MKKIAEILADNVLALREKLDLTQAELGARAGLSLETIAAYENQLRWPKPPQAEALAKALGVPTPALYSPGETMERVVEVDRFRDLVLSLATLDDKKMAHFASLLEAEAAGARGEPLPEPPDTPAKPRKAPRRAR